MHFNSSIERCLGQTLAHIEPICSPFWKLIRLVSTGIGWYQLCWNAKNHPDYSDNRWIGPPLIYNLVIICFCFFLLLTSLDCLQLTQCPKWEVKHDEAECTLESLWWNTDRHCAFLKTPSAPEKQFFNQPLRELTGEAWGLFPFKSHHCVGANITPFRSS